MNIAKTIFKQEIRIISTHHNPEQRYGKTYTTGNSPVGNM
jgi:hypothetical protein